MGPAGPRWAQGPLEGAQLADIRPAVAKWAQLGPDGPSWAQKGCRRAPESQISMHFWRRKGRWKGLPEASPNRRYQGRSALGRASKGPPKSQIPGQISDPRLQNSQIPVRIRAGKRFQRAPQIADTSAYLGWRWSLDKQNKTRNRRHRGATTTNPICRLNVFPWFLNFFGSTARRH